MEKSEQKSLREMAEELSKLRQSKAELEALNKAALHIEQKLEESEEQYRSVTQTSIDAIITADASGTIVTWNRGAELMFGFGREIIGQLVINIIPESLRDDHIKGFDRFLKTGEKKTIDKRMELEGLKKDGEVFPIELSLSTWKSYRGTFFGAIIRDITERKRVERIREDVERIIRHDLKSPLVGISGFAGLLLKSDGLNEKQSKYVDMIKDLSEKMYGSINRSLDFFKMEHGTYQMRPASFNLFKIFNNIRQLSEAFARKKAVTLSFFLFRRFLHPERMERMDYIVAGEESLLEVAFENLVKNAIEASPEGEEVRIDLAAEDDFHIVDIHNHGVIPKEIRNVFFEAYATCGKEGGTGLGTHSAQLVICSHGGEITFTSSEAEGTHLIVKLPKPVAAAPRK